MKVVYSSRAKEDVKNAFHWYENQRHGLGLDFLDCVEVAVKLIAAYPEIYEEQYRGLRRCVIRRFPYSVYYRMMNEMLRIEAVFDNRMNPSKQPV